jgi:hypothetical protein
MLTAFGPKRVLTDIQEIPKPISLGQFDSRDPLDDTAYSSWVYMVDLARIAGELVLPLASVSEVDAEKAIDRCDSKIVNWLISLPKWKQDIVDPEGVVDLVLFQSLGYAHA